MYTELLLCLALLVCLSRSLAGCLTNVPLHGHCISKTCMCMSCAYNVRVLQLSFINESEVSLDTFQFYAGPAGSGAPVHYHGRG